VSLPPHRLYLHVGHGKTGSSVIQSALANAADRLLELGYIYPELFDGANNDARANKISSGNIPMDVSVTEVLDALKLGLSGRRVICSSEHLSSRSYRHQLPEELRRVVFPGGPPKVLLMIRNPLEWVESRYQQMVKREGCTDPIEDVIAGTNRLGSVRHFLEIGKQTGVELTVRNYSYWSNSLEQVLAEWLNVDPSVFADLLTPRVNRSLTRSELELQRLFNVYSEGATSHFISDPLVNEIPDLPSDHVPWPEESFRAFYRRMEYETALTNEMLPESEHYVMPPLDKAIETYCHLPPTEDDYRFSSRQLNVLVAHLAAQLGQTSASSTAVPQVKVPEEEEHQLQAEVERLKAVETQLLLWQGSRTYRWTLRMRMIYSWLRTTVGRSG
jgi:hypothetical protein